MVVCAVQGLAFGIIRVPAYLPGRTPAGYRNWQASMYVLQVRPSVD
ncbi:MAG: hypothetical protein MIO93_03935 [ANME-2 cluster archaeon]|nr:hypothetical protein [ANME-2 cluster archaeon]